MTRNTFDLAVHVWPWLLPWVARPSGGMRRPMAGSVVSGGASDRKGPFGWSGRERQLTKKKQNYCFLTVIRAHYELSQLLRLVTVYHTFAEEGLYDS